MIGYVGITDFDWFTFLSNQPDVDEVNFWRPGGQLGFAALSPGAPFLFKLHAPRNFVAGGGFFVTFSRLPVSLAWEAFSIKNGARSFQEMRARVEKYRRVQSSGEDYTIGCIVLRDPFFFAERDWIPVPADWAPNIVSGRTYDLLVSPGRELWDAVETRLPARAPALVAEAPRYGTPLEVVPRLGQGAFRVLVTDAYERRCAITGERTLPALDAAHIKPYSGHGENRVSNGLLLRSDLHRLFDRGYLTVTPKLRVIVSPRIREEFSNGRDYYALSEREIRLPARGADRPDPRALEWHADTVFLR
jgi:putative restriction endonuclease